MTSISWTAVLLAAGKGTRMTSCKPKALQMQAGRSLVEHVLNTLDNLSINEAVIIHSLEANNDCEEVIIGRKNITLC
jgi:N-acetylglucosamine-1-phosphate uridyltransferase (contains nucleotidyltransferase and I-patch acetyltransferase domains)